MILGIVTGVVFGTTLGVTEGIAFSIAVAVTSSVSLGLIGTTRSFMVFVAALAVTSGITFGVTFGTTANATFIISACAAFGTLVSMINKSAVGLVAGIIFLACYFQLYRYLLECLLNTGLFSLTKIFPEHAFFLYLLSPINWDEIIWFPLPFLAQQLVLIANPPYNQGIREIRNIAESFRQQWAAQAALVELCAQAMENVTSVDDIASLPNNLWWPGRWQILPQLDVSPENCTSTLRDGSAPHSQEHQKRFKTNILWSLEQRQTPKLLAALTEYFDESVSALKHAVDETADTQRWSRLIIIRRGLSGNTFLQDNLPYSIC